MNLFPTLIEYLLLNHDYVVIPGLGTFIVQQMSARWNEEEEAFLPPYRSVRFNCDLTQDDDLLVKSIGEIFHQTPGQAAQTLTTWVAEFQQTLEDEGYIDFGAIGNFTQEEDGTTIFQSQESGVTTPEYYGLDAYHMGEIAPSQRAKVVPLTASMESDEKAITIRINRSIANIVVAACAAILLFMAFNLPGQGDNQQLRSSLKEMLMPTITAHQKEVTKVEPATEATVAEVSIPTPAETTQTEAKEEAPAVETKGEYCIVMASAIPMSNARKYVDELTQRGFLSARIVTHGNMVRVVVGHYPTEEAAASGAREIRQRSSDYNGAWVYQL